MSEENTAQAQPQTPEPSSTPDVAALEAELAKARDEILRALAEVENTRRRAERTAQEARAYAIDRFAADLLSVADTLGRALAAAPRDDLDEGFRNLLTGVEMTERALLDAFARHGLRRVGAQGDPFDPNVHEAVAQAHSDHPAGKIAEVMQAGYVLNDRTLRAARVVVSLGPAAAQAPASDVKNVDIKV